MGGGRDKRKKALEKKEGPVPGKGLQKTENKTSKNQAKQERRMESRLAGDEDDIDALLARFALEDKSRKEVQVFNDCDPPTARVNATWVPYIAPKVNDLLLFGGEYSELNSGKVTMFNDLYRFSTDKQRWSKICSPNSPSPRSAHQAVVHRGVMLLWGGEFTSPNQERFMHFKELWRLDLSTLEWDCLPSKAGPTARSGHRMVVWKGKAMMFGGFYDTGKEVRYYNDLWELDLSDNKWTSVGNPAAGPWPAARGGCQVVVTGDTMFLYGGYSKSPDDDDKEVEHGTVHDDLWALDLVKHTWERVKKVGMAPGARASFSMVAHKNRAFLFGGVSDHEAKGGEDLCSDFHNDLYQFSFEKRRWFAAQLKAPAGSKTSSTTGASETASVGANSVPSPVTPAPIAPPPPPTINSAPVRPALAAQLAEGTDRSSAVYRAVVRIQSRFRGYMVRKAYKLYQIGGVVSEILYSPAAYGLDLSALNMPKPRARISAQISVVGNTLWLFGGIVEVGEKEVTLDDVWSLDLAKLDGWCMIKENTCGEAAFKAAAGDLTSSDGEDDGEECD